MAIRERERERGREGERGSEEGGKGERARYSAKVERGEGKRRYRKTEEKKERRSRGEQRPDPTDR